MTNIAVIFSYHKRLNFFSFVAHLIVAVTCPWRDRTNNRWDRPAAASSVRFVIIYRHRTYTYAVLLHICITVARERMHCLVHNNIFNTSSDLLNWRVAAACKLVCCTTSRYSRSPCLFADHRAEEGKWKKLIDNKNPPTHISCPPSTCVLRLIIVLTPYLGLNSRLFLVYTYQAYLYSSEPIAMYTITIVF